MRAIVDFILELDKLKGVTRKIKPLGLDRYENSAEHSWQLALLAMSLAPHAEVGTDIPRVVQMLLVHDVGEIDTGDTIAFEENGLADRKAAERVCVTRIFDLLPEPQRSSMLSLWVEFDEEQTKEARFAHAIDRAMPVLLNLANNGQSWRENSITYERLVKRIESEIRNGCPPLWDHIEARLNEERAKGWFA